MVNAFLCHSLISDPPWVKRLCLFKVNVVSFRKFETQLRYLGLKYGKGGVGGWGPKGSKSQHETDEADTTKTTGKRPEVLVYDVPVGLAIKVLGSPCKKVHKNLRRRKVLEILGRRGRGWGGMRQFESVVDGTEGHRGTKIIEFNLNARCL